MVPPAGFTSLVAARIQDAAGNLLPLGTLEVLPSDIHGRALTAVAGGVGGPMLTRAIVFQVVNGALPQGIYIADTALTRPPNICYRFIVRDFLECIVLDLKGVQFAPAPTATPVFDLDTYTPNIGVQAVVQTGPVGASAYQVWLQAGNQGTPQQFLDSLIGAPGTPGQPGTSNIKDGITGVTYTFVINNGVINAFPAALVNGTPTSMVLADVSSGGHMALTVNGGALNPLNIGTLGVLASSATLIDSVTGQYWLLSFSSGTLSPQPVASSSGGVDSFRFADLQTGQHFLLTIADATIQLDPA